MANLLKVVMVEMIVSLRKRGWSQRRIARELGIDRETVARQLRLAALDSKPPNAPIGSTPSGGESKPANAPIGSEGGSDSSKPANAPIGSDPRSEAVTEPGTTVATANPSIKKKQIFDLATCRFVRETRDVHFLGPPGVGK